MEYKMSVTAGTSGMYIVIQCDEVQDLALNIRVTYHTEHGKPAFIDASLHYKSTQSKQAIFSGAVGTSPSWIPPYGASTFHNAPFLWIRTVFDMCSIWLCGVHSIGLDEFLEEAWSGSTSLTRA